MAKTRNYSSKAIASFVFGFFSFLLSFVELAIVFFGRMDISILIMISGITSGVAVFFGFVALGQIKKNKKLIGKFLAIVGIVLGFFGLVLICFIYYYASNHGFAS